MTQRTTANSIQVPSFASLPSRLSIRFFLRSTRFALACGLTTAALLAVPIGAWAQDAAQPANASTPAVTTAPAAQTATTAVSNAKPGKTRKEDKKEDKVVVSKDTKEAEKKAKKDNPLAGQDAKLPDKELYDKAEDAAKRGHYDVARLDLQTLLNTYPDSQFMMRAKLAIADSWYKEGGAAALTSAEQEYKDFITFFPNSPEAAEAQMRVGDIYFRQMDKPDRDYTMTSNAEAEYRLMLQQFPDSPLVPQATQKLREVQEVLAARETSIASFYQTRQPPNYAGAIARYQTVVDTYPLYSHMDEVLLGLGDSYEAEAQQIRNVKAPAGASSAEREVLDSAKARLLKVYEDEAASAYSQVVLEHAAAPHVEDAKDRLAGMGRPIPVPTVEQLAASTALENSRGQYTLSKRAISFFVSQADTVPAATIGDPSLEDPKPTFASAIVKKEKEDYEAAMNPGASPRVADANAPAASASPTPDATTGAPTPPAAASNAPLSLQDVPAANASTADASPVVTSVPAEASPASSGGGSNVGIEIVNPGTNGPGANGSAPTTAFPGTAAASSATTTTPAPAAVAGDPAGGIAPVGPKDATPLAPIEKAATAPDAVNDAAGAKLPAAQAPAANGKKVKTACDKNDQSCSDHKKKKGLDKLNPF